jgi:hypothetical protein
MINCDASINLYQGGVGPEGEFKRILRVAPPGPATLDSVSAATGLTRLSWAIPVPELKFVG